MAEKILNTRMQQKHDTEANWNKATNFKPLLGEIIVYDRDSTHNYERQKIGDGVTTVKNLPFIRASYADTAGTANNVEWDNTNHPSTFPPSSHNHDERYYTEKEIDNKFTTDLYEANLKWGKSSHAYSFSPIDASLIPNLGANRLAFMPAKAITVEYSRDGGKTWNIYEVSDASKISCFDGEYGAGYSIGNGSSQKNINKDNYQLRITIDSVKGKVYTGLNKFCIYVSTNGTQDCWCTVSTQTHSQVVAGKGEQTIFADKVHIAGWSGYNIINTTTIYTYANNVDSYHEKIIFTFGGKHSADSSYTGLVVLGITGFGGVGWTAPSNLAKKGIIYSYDYQQNVTFPANVKATSKFIGSLQGNADTSNSAVLAESISISTLEENKSCPLVFNKENKLYNDTDLKYNSYTNDLIVPHLSSAGHSSSWIQGRNNAIIKMNQLNGYSAVMSVKTTAGSWEVGAYSSSSYTDKLIFVRCSDDNYADGINETRAKITFDADGGITADALHGVADDSKKLNGQEASYYLNYNNLSNKPTIPTIPTNHVTIDTVQTISANKTFTGKLYFNSGITHETDGVDYFLGIKAFSGTNGEVTWCSPSEAKVGYATSAGSAKTAGSATSAGTATRATTADKTDAVTDIGDPHKTAKIQFSASGPDLTTTSWFAAFDGSTIKKLPVANAKTTLGLGSAAYKNESYFALSGHTHKYAASNSVGGSANTVNTTTGDADIARPIFFGYNGDNTKLVYNTNFQYNPSTKILSVDKIDNNEFIAPSSNTTNVHPTKDLGWNINSRMVESITNLFPHSNNANAILTINKHQGYYDSQLGFSSNGNLYYRNFNGASDYDTHAWSRIAFASDIPSQVYHVRQSYTSNSSNWRPVTFGASYNSNEEFTPSTTSDEIYTTKDIKIQPSTGTLKTNILKGNILQLADSAKIQYNTSLDCIEFLFI